MTSGLSHTSSGIGGVWGYAFVLSMDLTTIFQSIQHLLGYILPLVIVGFLVQEWLAIFQDADVVLPLEK